MAKKIDIDTKTFVRFWLVIFGMGLLVMFIFQALTGILLVVLSIFLAIALKPIANRFSRINKKRNRDSLASVVTVVLVVTGIVGVVALVLPIVVNEAVKFTGQASNNIEQLSHAVDLDAFGQAFGIEGLRGQVVTAVKEWSNSLMSNFGNFAVNSIGAVGSFLAATVLVLVLTTLFMLEGPKLVNSLWRAVEKRRGKKAAEVWRRVTTRIANVISKYVSRQALIALIDGVVTMSIITILMTMFPEIPGSYIAPLGLLAAALYMIPMFGPIINAVIVTLLLMANSVPAALIYLVLYLVCGQIEGNMIAPKLQGKGVGLSPLTILVSITIGMYAYGIVGAFAAIPVAGCIKVLLEEYPKIKALSSE